MAHQICCATYEGPSGRCWFCRGQFFHIQALFQDAFDGYVRRVIEAQGTDTGGFEPLWSKAFTQPQQSPRGPQSILGPVV